MLEELDIRNLGPIREATIAPAAGMTAITGETGAGKSMLLSAIRLVSGGAAESSRVSSGADEAWAQAIFALSDDAVASEHSGDTNDAGSGDADSGFTGAAAAVAKAHDAGVDPEDGELFLSRTVRASGRSRAVLGGTFAEQADRLESINADLGDVVFALSQELGDEGSVEDLDQINGRIHELGDLTRRWGPTLADVLAWRDKAAFDLEDLDASPEKVAELESERQTLYDAALAAADVLSAARVAAAADLGARVTEELGSLAMLGASLEVRVTPRDKADDPLGPYGRDDIAFLFTPFEGSPQLPMGKSASGGDLSRLMLALELVAADTRGGADQTFIFDEVDAGVGGKAAVELGKRLARLARSAQVIVVTHLAQVASWADAQFVVTKEPPDADDDDLGVVTTIAEVNGETRVHEIARMLSGSESEASLDHARELLSDSRLTLPLAGAGAAGD